MRNIFFALVLANLAFAAWHSWFSQDPRPVRSEDPDLPPIVLVKELPADVPAPSDGAAPAVDVPASASANDAAAGAGELAEPAGGEQVVADQPAGEQPAGDIAAAVAAASPEAQPPAAPVEASAVSCTSVGPFRELAQAATAAANLRAAGYEPMQRVAEGDIWIGYWVYIDAISTGAEANQTLEKIRAGGIADSYVIPNSDTGNLISLGVFSEISGVSTQREKVRALGFEPKVVDRTRRATVYWVDVLLKEGQVLDFDALQTPGRITRLEQRACDASAAQGASGAPPA